MSRISRQRKRGQYGPLKIRVMAEYASSGMWEIGTVGLFRHGMVGAGYLKLPAELAAQFEQWIASYELKLEDAPFDTDAFNQTGRTLAQALKAHLGPDSYVEFVPEDAETGLGTPEIMESE